MTLCRGLVVGCQMTAMKWIKRVDNEERKWDVQGLNMQRERERAGTLKVGDVSSMSIPKGKVPMWEQCVEDIAKNIFPYNKPNTSIHIMI